MHLVLLVAKIDVDADAGGGVYADVDDDAALVA